MKKAIYAMILLLVVVSGLVFANRETNNETKMKPCAKPLTADEKNAELKIWKASPDGIKFRQWEVSPTGKKVLACAAKIQNEVNTYTNMEATVTSLSLSPGSRLGFGVMVKIDNEDYILSFGQEDSDNYQKLHSLKENDKINIRSKAVSYAPKYFYPIIAADYVERNGEVVYKRIPRKGGC